MMENPELYNLSPLATLLLLGGGLALLPLAWVAWRNRRASSKQRWKSLALLTLFLTFDLVLFGAFTRLTDSGLGCPDWPGCYGSASPLGAKSHIAQAQSALPSGPVTQGKAWIEMVHRYLATGVGALILVLTVVAWRAGRKTDAQAGVPLGLALFTLFWVCLQGAFGALTVTMKLFPAIVTLHLLGGYVLLALLTVQWVALSPFSVMKGSELSSPLRWGIGLALVWLLIQAASGAWVSTNYAVLVLAGLAWRLSRIEPLRQPAQWLGGLLVLQVSTGLSNVVFDWPLLAAVLHTGGAGALVVVLVFLWAATKPVNAGPKAVYLQAGVAV